MSDGRSPQGDAAVLAELEDALRGVPWYCLERHYGPTDHEHCLKAPDISEMARAVLAVVERLATPPASVSAEWPADMARAVQAFLGRLSPEDRQTFNALVKIARDVRIGELEQANRRLADQALSQDAFTRLRERVAALEAGLRQADEANDFAYAALRGAVAVMPDAPAGYEAIRMIQNTRRETRALLTPSPSAPKPPQAPEETKGFPEPPLYDKMGDSVLMPMYCAQCDALTHDVKPMYTGRDGFGRGTWALKCPTCRQERDQRWR